VGATPQLSQYVVGILVTIQYQNAMQQWLQQWMPTIEEGALNAKQVPRDPKDVDSAAQCGYKNSHGLALTYHT